jgi:hypothetical protein
MQHVADSFLVVQPFHMDDGTLLFRAAMASRKGVPRFRPAIRMPAAYSLNDDFLDLIFHKRM